MLHQKDVISINETNQNVGVQNRRRVYLYASGYICMLPIYYLLNAICLISRAFKCLQNASVSKYIMYSWALCTDLHSYKKFKKVTRDIFCFRFYFENCSVSVQVYHKTPPDRRYNFFFKLLFITIVQRTPKYTIIQLKNF